MRSHVQAAGEFGIYRVQLPRQWDWAACYVDDELIPGTRAGRKKDKEDQELRATLGLLTGPSSDTRIKPARSAK